MLAIGSEDKVRPLLSRTLQRLIFHTAFPCGMVLQDVLDKKKPGQSRTMKLEAAIGDYRLLEHVGEELGMPRDLTDGPADQFAVTSLHVLPVHQNHYHEVIRLPVPDFGTILLLSPEKMDSDIPFTEIFKPVLGNLSKTIRLCQRNEMYTNSLLAERDAVMVANERFRHALDTSQDAILLIDVEKMQFIDFNQTAVDALGYSHEELLEMGPQDITTDFDLAGLSEFLNQQIITEQASEIISIAKRKNGRTYPIEIHFGIARQEGQSSLVIAVVRDITERKEAEESLFQEKERAQVTLQSIGDAVITTDKAGHVDYLNPIAEQLIGWKLSEASGKPLQTIFNIIDENTRLPASNPVEKCLREGRIVGLANHTVLIDRNGMETAIEDSAAPIRNRNGEITGVVMVFHDVSKTRKMASELNWHASHDHLTGLYNRRKFDERLSEILHLSRSDSSHHVLLYLDIDQFKVINDTCGHTAGDEMLKQISALLRDNVRDYDTLARLGGDEFGLLLIDCGIEQAQEKANRVREMVHKYRFKWKERTFEVGVSIGLAEITAECLDISQIMSSADVACFAAKDLGRNRIHVYHAGDEDLARRHDEMHWVSRITEALEQDRFELFCQSILPARGEASKTHYEILVRMRGEDNELIPPNAFIPAAERYNIMPAVDRWVIEHTFAAFKSCVTQGQKSHCLLSINLSGSSLNDDSFLGFISDALARFDLSPGNFCFEITETAAISNLSVARNFIGSLKKLGCRFALDDFGSGLSSFTYLKNLPVDYLKIDGSFVKDMLNDPIDAAMVEAINRVGQVMGLQTIAEFVESEEILQRLAGIGIDYVQGYAIHRPEPLKSAMPLALQAQQPASKQDASRMNT
jgi:diguanylate cyclase (GGDEF)-like protein/PAS domain S-box-containing protein